jgi:hypothetical protein
MSWTYDVSVGTGNGVDNGILTIVGNGELTQAIVNDAIDAYQNSLDTSVILTTLVIGQNFTSLGDSAISGTGFTSIVFPPESKVTYIGTKGLNNNSLLTQVILPLGLLHLSSQILTDCPALVNIVIPDSVKTIGDSAFEKCGALTSMAVPASVTMIVDNAFRACERLGSVLFSPVSTLTKVGDAVFALCVKLIVINFPSSLLDFGMETFDGCSQLKSVGLSEDLRSVGDGMFRDCTGLQRFEFPLAFTGPIGVDTFQGAVNLQTLKMDRDLWTDVLDQNLPVNNAVRQVVSFYSEPASVYSWSDIIQRDHWAYDQVAGVEENYTYQDGSVGLLGIGELTQSQVNAAIDEHYRRGGLSNLEKICIGPLLTSVGASAINGTGVTSIVFDPESQVTSIGTNGLGNNSLLTKVTLPPGLLHLSVRILSGCESLVSVVIPTTVKTIGDSTFKNCSALTIIDILSTVVTHVVESAFVGCTNIQTLAMEESLFDSLRDFIPLNTFNNVTQVVSFRTNDFYTIVIGTKDLVLGTGMSFNTAEKTLSGSYNGQALVLLGVDTLTPVQVTEALETYLAQNGSSRLLDSLLISREFLSVAPGAFSNALSLISIVFENASKIKTLDTDIFQGLVLLQNVVFPELLTSTETGTFATITNIRTLTMNSKVWYTIIKSLLPNPPQTITFFEDVNTYTVVRDAKNAYVHLLTASGAIAYQAIRVIGRSGGDPYIRCVETGTTVKLPNCTDVYRMYQNKRTGSIINCRVGPKICTFEEVRLGEWGKTIEEGYFFTDLFIYDGVTKMSQNIDLMDPHILTSPSLPWCKGEKVRTETGSENLFIGDYTARVLEVCDGGEIDLRLYPNPSIRNDLQFTLPGQMDGLLYKNYRPKLWRCNRIDDTKLMRITAGRPLTSRGIVGHLEVKEAVQHQNMFYQMFVK